MKLLLAVVTCEKFRHRADAQRQVWVPTINWADVRFFLAKQERKPLPDEVFLDVPDDYHSLPMKVRATYQWALANGYTKALKLDDDTLVVSSRMQAAVPDMDYVGFLNATPPKHWCSGYCYWVSERAMRILADAQIPAEEWAEDRWAGSVLHDHGIFPQYDQRFALRIPGWREPNWRGCVAICDCTSDNSHPGSDKPYSMQQLQNLCGQ